MNKVTAKQLVRVKCRQNLTAGAKLLFQRRFEEALVKFQKVLMFDPHNANAFALKSKCYLQMCDLKSAISNLKKAVELDPEELDWTKQLSILIDAQGLNLLDQVRIKAVGWRNLLQRAIGFFNQAIEADTSEPYFWLHRAIAFTLQNNYQSAVTDLERYVTIDLHNTEVYIMLAKLKWRINAQHQGQANLDKAHALEPKHPEVKILKRSVAKRNQQVYQRTARMMLLKDNITVLDELDRALVVSPTNVDMLLLRAAAYRNIGELQHSLDDIKRAKEVYTHSVLEHRRVLRLETGSRRHVEDTPEMILQRNQTMNEIGLREMRLGHVRAAWSIFNDVVKADLALAEGDPKYRQSPQFLLNRGDSQRKAGNWPQAFQDYWRALQLNPESIETKSRIALVYNEFATNQYNRRAYYKAVLLYSKAIDMFPDSSHLYLGRAKAHFHNHDLLTSRKDLERAVEKDPGNVEAMQRLKKLCTLNHKSTSLVPSYQAAKCSSSKNRVPGIVRGNASSRSSIMKPGDYVIFPYNKAPTNHLGVKDLPGRHSMDNDGFSVPQSFGTGVRVLPKNDVKNVSQKQNMITSKRPLR